MDKECRYDVTGQCVNPDCWERDPGHTWDDVAKPASFPGYALACIAAILCGSGLAMAIGYALHLLVCGGGHVH